jgi:multidrug efflux system outer membrane protein
MKQYLHCFLMATIAFASGCTMIPTYERPGAPVPTAWPEGPAYRDAISNEQSAADMPWREFFTDPKLQHVIEMALTNNRDLRLAALNAERVKALYGIQRSELFPSVTAFGGGAKQRASADLTQPGQPRTTERYDVNLGILSWEVDLFGRIRSLKEQALREYLATEEARRGAQVALVSATASAYLALATDQENLNLAQSTLKTQEDAYALIQKQFDAGVATEMDLRRAQTQVDAARADAARFTQMVAQDRNALNLLAGASVPDEWLPGGLADVAPVADITPGLPSDVLLHRPDILAAEQQLRGAQAFIGAARSAFFPRIALTTALGTASDELSGLFGSGSGTWSFAPTISMPIFDARTWAAYRVSKATREIALAQYEKAIQTAFRDVADALAVQGAVDRQIAAQESIVESLTTIHKLADQLYRQGVVGYIEVLDAQRSLYATQQGLNALRLARAANQVRLYAVLGGGGGPQDTDSNADNRVSGK